MSKELSNKLDCTCWSCAWSRARSQASEQAMNRAVLMISRAQTGEIPQEADRAIDHMKASGPRMLGTGLVTSGHVDRQQSSARTRISRAVSTLELSSSRNEAKPRVSQYSCEFTSASHVISSTARAASSRKHLKHDIHPWHMPSQAIHLINRYRSVLDGYSDPHRTAKVGPTDHADGTITISPALTLV